MYLEKLLTVEFRTEPSGVTEKSNMTTSQKHHQYRGAESKYLSPFLFGKVRFSIHTISREQQLLTFTPTP
jgi:hypothetical protein